MTQSQVTTPPPAPAAPPAPTGTPRVVGAEGLPGRTFTNADIAALKARKNELSNLLSSATNRREQVQSALRQSIAGQDRAGLEQRLGVLDARIARLETEIDENSGQLASLDAAKLTSTTGRPWDDVPRGADRAMAPVGIAVTIFVLGPIAFAIARSIWRRGSRPLVSPVSAEHSQRLERIEQAVDAIAIEVERVSEGQRFVTRLMSEGRGGALAAAEPVRVGGESGVDRR